MSATALLVHEHRQIERVLGALDRLAGQAAGGPGDAPALAPALAEAVALLRGYADRAHHGKEEEHLFPALAAAGLGPGEGPVAVMLEEHEVGRRELDAVADALADLGAGAPDAGEDLARHVAAYTALLRDHIEKEDAVLFPMADEVVDAGALAAGFAAADAAAFGPEGRAGWERRIDALVATARGRASAPA